MKPGAPSSKSIPLLLLAAALAGFGLTPTAGATTLRTPGGAVSIGVAHFVALDPTLSEEQASSVEAEAATLQAEVDPEEEATTFRFEYDTMPYTGAAGHGVQTPEEELPAGNTPVLVTARIKGLTPGTTYYYRVVATNGSGTVDGASQSFTTNAAPGSEPAGSCPNEARRGEQPFGLALPDCRAYELVSPENTEGQDATDSFIDPNSEAAVSGEAITYPTKGSFGSALGAGSENQYVSRRGATGWLTVSISPLQDPAYSLTNDAFQSTLFTPELTAGIALSSAPHDGEGPEGENGLYLASFATGAYRYLGVGRVPDGASTDLSRVVIGEFGGLTEWVEGAVVPVSVTNARESMEASVGSAANNGSAGWKTFHDVWHAVSADGSRVYFTSPGFEVAKGARQLYVRVNVEASQSPMSGEECEVAADACTVEVSASQRATPDPHGPQSARYWGASADGSRVFFTSSAELTEDAYTGPADNAENLYEYELASEPGKPGRLTDLTVDPAGEGAAVQGVVQISEDGSYVYFVADGALAEGATAGEPNLYVIHEGGAPVFRRSVDDQR